MSIPFNKRGRAVDDRGGADQPFAEEVPIEKLCRPHRAVARAAVPLSPSPRPLQGFMNKVNQFEAAQRNLLSLFTVPENAFKV